MSVKKPDPIDVHVGARVQLRRMLLGISQEKLSDPLGITFQQIQKYEKGVNRLAIAIADRLTSNLTYSLEAVTMELRNK